MADDELEILNAIYAEDLIGPDHMGWYSIRIGGPYDINGMEQDISFYFQHEPGCSLPNIRFTGLLEEQESKLKDYINSDLLIPDEPSLFNVISWLMTDMQLYLELKNYVKVRIIFEIYKEYNYLMNY